MKEKCGNCTDFSFADGDPTRKVGVCYRDKAYQRVNANQTPKDVDLNGGTCFSLGQDGMIPTQCFCPHTNWWTLIIRQLIK